MSIAIRAAGVISVFAVLGVAALTELSREPAALQVQSSRLPVMRPVMIARDTIPLITAASPDNLIVTFTPKG